ncbi:MAG TPA: bifunctional UDP-N-acetylglucosamine diphosphorylase/glucosamine-1-phosphate N-acetyltransferase GlmU, partial [Rubrivivax sp.]|nr:bifunctional UDP-N-acetylglucosamine diphosphorylase/glucosamine-1-phosphate N-acetyltransferase GlmU [Rubrivivax sp.]
MAPNVVIMAAGKGTRMKSERPKVLHRLAGKSLLQHVLDAASPLGSARTVIITGHGADMVEQACAQSGAVFARQMPQLGTGHAVQQAVPALDDSQPITLILNGDVPLIRAETIRALVHACAGERLALLTVVLTDATGYGRIVRDGQAVRAIVEHKDANEEQRHIREVYTGIMAAPTAALKRWVMALTNNNAQREYYLTDVVAMAVAEAVPVVTAQASGETEVLGVNSPVQLAELERRFQRQQAEALMEAGVRLADPARLDVRGELHCGSDVEIDVNCVFEGQVHIGSGVRIGAHCVIRDARIGEDVTIHPFTHIEGASIGAGALVGPFARLRPGAQLGAQVHIGNFVEVKNAT